MKTAGWFAARCAAAAVLCAVALSGCKNLTAVSRGAEVKIKGKVLIVPLRTERQYYYDSDDGAIVALAAAQALRVNTQSLRPVDCSPVRGLVRSTILEESVDDAQWTAIGKAAGADYVVYGSIDRLAWVDPNDPGMPRCTFTVTYGLVDAGAGKGIGTMQTSGRYPFMLVADRGVTVYEMGNERFRAQAYAYIGQIIARTFYGYTMNRLEDRATTVIVRKPPK